MSLRGNPPPGLGDVLTVAAREIAAVGWAFTGFNLPCLAARIARRRPGRGFVQLLEAGIALDRDSPQLPSSTTDVHAYADAICWRGSVTDALVSLVPRCDLVVLDGATIDLRGRTNAHAVGPADHPLVKLPGAGGAPEAAAGAHDLLFLNGGSDVRRISQSVEHVSTVPNPAARVRLVTRWGVLDLGDAPRLAYVLDGPGTSEAVDHLAAVGVDTTGAEPLAPIEPWERTIAVQVLTEAAGRGYDAAARALDTAERVPR